MQNKIEKKRCKFTETLWEDYVNDHPKEFLNEELTKNTRQNIIPAGKSDLTFRDKSGKLVLVELQLDALDRKHMSQTLEYRMDYIDKGEKNIRTILLCNQIKEKRKDYIDKWNKTVPNLNLETVIISKDEARKIIQKIDPSIEWIDIKKKFSLNNKQSQNLNRNISKAKLEDFDLSEAMNKRKSVKIVKELFDKHRSNRSMITPQIKIGNYIDSNHGHDVMNDLYNLKKELEDLQNQFSDIYPSFYKYQRIVDDYINFFRDIYDYKKLLFMPGIVDKTEKDNKPEIDLILFTDTYFSRRTFRLLWQPTNWKYDAHYDEKSLEKINSDFEEKKKKFLLENKKNEDYWDTFDAALSKEKTQIIRDRNSKLHELKKWLISGGDFYISSSFAENYTYYKLGRDYFLILDIKDAFEEGSVNYFRKMAPKNFWGRLGVCLTGIVRYVQDLLSVNFKVNIKGKIKFITDKINEDDKTLINAHYYCKNTDDQRINDKLYFERSNGRSDDENEVIVGFEIEDANHKIGATFYDKNQFNYFS